MTASNVVLYNADYQFLNFISWKRAINLLLQGKVEVVEYADHTVASERDSFKLPKILRLVQMVSVIYKLKVPYKKSIVLLRDGYTCGYCGVKSKKDLTIDHILPKSRGGANSYKNTVACCKECNNKKGDRTPEEAHMWLRKDPYAPTIADVFRLRTKYVNLELNK